jgi:hypothetical protein
VVLTLRRKGWRITVAEFFGSQDPAIEGVVDKDFLITSPLY